MKHDIFKISIGIVASIINLFYINAFVPKTADGRVKEDTATGNQQVAKS